MARSNEKVVLARASGPTRRRRLIKIAWIRFSGIAAATVGRFSTAWHHRLTRLPIRSSPSTRPSSPSPVYPAGTASVPLQPALFPTLYHASPSLSPSRPRLARPFGVVYASGIQMTAFARAEECPTISAWLRSPTTRLQRGIRSLISFFPLLRHAPDPATCYCVHTSPPFASPIVRFQCIPATFSPDSHVNPFRYRFR